MTAPDLAGAAAKALAEEMIDADDASSTARARMVAAIEAELTLRAARARRRRWALPMGGVAAAAALLVVGASVWSRRAPAPVAVASAPRALAVVADTVRGTVFVEQNGERVPLRPAFVLKRGSSIEALDGEAILVLRSGSRVDVEHATAAALLEDGDTEMMELERGAVTSVVTKRAAGERFIVRTPDAEVEVRGTVFRVSRLVGAECGFQTRVHVDEGRVVVRAGATGVTLERGGEWTSVCTTPAGATGALVATAEPSVTAATAAASVTPAAAATAALPAPPLPARAVSPPSTSRAASTPVVSDLAAQNALFADAMSSKARGDTASALTSLEFLIQKYPHTPLREAAEAQRMLLVASSDRQRASALAKAYLSRYPHGFARADAERLLALAP